MQGFFFFCCLFVFSLAQNRDLCSSSLSKKRVEYELREPLGFEDSEAAREHSSSLFAKD